MKHPILNELQVKVNCLTSYPNHLISDSQKQKWIKLIEDYKQSEEWTNTEKPPYDYLEGRRFNDNERVLDVILGNIRSVIQNHYLWHHPTTIFDYEEAFKYYVDYIDESKWNEWINVALLYSAGCDHWYTFEKEW